MTDLPQQLDRIEAKLDRLIGGPPSETVHLKEVMLMTGTRTYTSVYRTLQALCVKPYLHGKYRRKDIENAIAEKLLRDQLAGKSPSNSPKHTD